MPISKVLVLGSTGGYGRAITAELLSRGLSVKVMVRSPEKFATLFSTQDKLEVVAGDAEDQPALGKAAEGCDAIVHSVSFPYDKWVPHMETVTNNVISAAEASGATILFPGNIYGLGNQCNKPLSDDAENNPCSKKGELRVQLEKKLAAMAQKNGKVIIVRAGDFFGPTVRNGFVDPIFGNAVNNKAISALGNLEIPHQWAYVPDLARLSVDLLLMQEELSAFEVVNFSGHVVDSQRKFFQSILSVAGNSALAIKTTPWGVLRIVGFFVGVVRELIELKYLHENSIILDDPKRKKLLPNFETTPLDIAVKETLESYAS